MKKVIIAMFMALTTVGYAQQELLEIQKTLDRYIEGTSYNKPEMIRSAFYEDADLFLSKKGQELFILKPDTYAAPFGKKQQGTFNGRTGKVLDISLANNIAIARAEIYIEEGNLRFVDLFLLKKLSGEWKIISKAATLVTTP
ncbi:MAG: nuclear transport factor 2 family protein [Bacteroidota bacterium]